MDPITPNILVTAVVTTYNRPRLVQRAIQSVLDQTYEPLEILVVEDGTDSGVKTWLCESNLSSVRYIRHKDNKGLAAARNTGLQHASGEYVAYLDDDDQWKPDRIAKQVELLTDLHASRRDKTGVVYTSYETRYPHDTVIANEIEYNSGQLKNAILQQRHLTTPPSSFLFKATALKQVGGFDEQLTSSIDHDIWMALAEAGYHAYYVDEPLVINSKEGHSTMVTNTTDRVRGIRQFADKWRPVFVSWMGEERGGKFTDQYVARVLAKLAGEKAERGEGKGVLQVCALSFKQSTLSVYNLPVYIESICRGMGRRFIPWKARKQIKRIASRFYVNSRK